MVRLGMSKPINEIDFLQDLLNQSGTSSDPAGIHRKSNSQNDLSTPSISHTTPTRHGGRPITSIFGNPPTKPVGPIIGSCSLCNKPATRRFNTIQYCNPHYRKNLQIRKDDLFFSQHYQDIDFDLNAWKEYLKERDSK